MNEAELWVVYSTFPTREEALSAARALVEKRLIACANVQDGVTSVYRWEGEARQETEATLLAKTTACRVQAAIEALTSLHSYAVPCVIAWLAGAAAPAFAQWTQDEVHGGQ